MRADLTGPGDVSVPSGFIALKIVSTSSRLVIDSCARSASFSCACYLASQLPRRQWPRRKRRQRRRSRPCSSPASSPDKIIGQSQEVLTDAQAELKIGFFRGIFLLPAALGAKKNADGKRLKDILPPDLYARWLPLKQRYLGKDDGVERLRPILAANELYGKAIGKSGMTNKNALWPTIEKIAKSHRVPIKEIDVEIPIDNARQAIDDFKSTAGQLDIDCLATTIARLETDLDAMRARANAWAIGDLEKLKSLPYPDQRTVCLNALAANANLREKLADAKKRIQNEWLDAAEAALWNNASTFAVLPITDLTQSDGRLAMMRAKGYVIEEPQ